MLYYCRVPVKVGKLSSTATHLPYDYYDGPFCRPDKVVSPRANLGEVLTGDILHTSGYELKMMVNETCKELCTYVLQSATVAVKHILLYKDLNFITLATGMAYEQDICIIALQSA